MYAVIKSGGKQYKVSVGSELNIEKINANVGDVVNCFDVLLYKSEDELLVGSPLNNVCVNASVVDHGRAKKVIIFKMSRRKHSRSRTGHRQYYTKIKVDSIELV